jgi:hypothetical protein
MKKFLSTMSLMIIMTIFVSVQTIEIRAESSWFNWVPSWQQIKEKIGLPSSQEAIAISCANMGTQLKNQIKAQLPESWQSTTENPYFWTAVCATGALLAGGTLYRGYKWYQGPTDTVKTSEPESAAAVAANERLDAFIDALDHQNIDELKSAIERFEPETPVGKLAEIGDKSWFNFIKRAIDTINGPVGHDMDKKFKNDALTILNSIIKSYVTEAFQQVNDELSGYF